MSTSPILAVASASYAWHQAPYAVFAGQYRGFSARAHTHPEGQLLVPLNGRMHLVAGSSQQVLGPEAAAWLPPGLAHGFFHVDGRLDFLAVEVAPDALPAGVADAPGDRPLVARAPGLWHLGRAIAHELETAPAGLDEVVAGCLPPLFAYVARALAAGTGAAVGSPEVRRVVEAILAGYAEDLRVPDLAELAGLSARQLERRFDLELGRTPKRFLTEVRVGAAERLLATTDHPVARIALEVGFANPSHFAATFKALTGRAPRQGRS